MEIFGVEVDPRILTGLALGAASLVAWTLSLGTEGLVSGAKRWVHRLWSRTKSGAPFASPYHGGADDPAPPGAEKSPPVIPMSPATKDSASRAFTWKTLSVTEIGAGLEPRKTKAEGGAMLSVGPAEAAGGRQEGSRASSQANHTERWRMSQGTRDHI